MVYKATNLIATAFDEHGIKYRVSDDERISVVDAGLEIEAGPDVTVHFISNNDNNDVAIRIFGLMHRVPSAKRPAMLEACNRLSERVRFYKFYLDSKGNVNVEADLPLRIDDDSVGECCFEFFVRVMHILDNEYHVLAEALYGNGKSSSESQIEILKAIQDLRDKPIVLSNEGTTRQ